MHPVTAEVTERIVERSRETRADYLGRMEAARHAGTGRGKLSCANWAHAFAAESDGDRTSGICQLVQSRFTTCSVQASWMQLTRP